MITLHWHTILFAIIIILILVRAFKGEGGLDLSFPLFFCIALVLTLVYGGIFWW